MNCYLQLLDSYHTLKDRTCFLFMGKKLKLSQFLHDIDRLAEFFQQQGLNNGDVYTIFLPNCIQSFALFYALNKIGVIANIIHPLTPQNTLLKTVEETHSKGVALLDILVNGYAKPLLENKVPLLIVSNSDYAAAYVKPFIQLFEAVKAPRIQKVPHAVYHYKKIIHRTPVSVAQKPGKETPKTVAVYLHSGGTMGDNKTIMLSNHAIVQLSRKLLAINPKPTLNKDYSLNILPIFHAYGLVAGMHSLLLQGYISIPILKFNAKKINRTLKHHRVTTLIGVPLMYAKMLQQKNFRGAHLKKLQNIYCGGDFVSIALQNQFNETIAAYGGHAKMLAGYGLTETCSVCAVNTPQHYKLGSNGQALSEIEIEIWDENGKVLPPHQMGEVMVSGSTLMNGYWGKTPCGLSVKNGINFLATGDQGYLDEEGYLFIVDRKKRLIKIAAYNVFPAQIEKEVSYLPFVEEACALESMQNGKKIVKLLVVLKNNECSMDNATSKILSHCQENLMKYAIPKEILFVDRLPRTKMSKLDYVKINELYRQ